MPRKRQRNRSLQLLHEYVNYRYLELNGRIKKTLQFPRRERVLVRKALGSLNVKYRELVPFINPLYRGWKNTTPAAIQWLDFAIFYDKLMVVQFHPKYPSGGVKHYEWDKFFALLDYLEEREVPYVVVERRHTSQEYRFYIDGLLKGGTNDPYHNRPTRP